MKNCPVCGEAMSSESFSSEDGDYLGYFCSNVECSEYNSALAGDNPIVISSFKGEYDFLSNFYWCLIRMDGKYWPSVEHAYQAAKTVDKQERKYIHAAPTPGAAKRQGRKITLRPDWEEIKVEIMRQLLCEKFTWHDELRDKLLATGDAELIEGNHWGDTFWGVYQGQGQNMLGKLLMEIRSELVEES